MHVMVRESWTDERLDEFGKRMDERFEQVDKRFDRVDKRFEQVDKRFEQVDQRLDRLADGLESVRKALIFGAITMSSAFVAGFAAMATQI
jgi:DNA anti-recombination protein RmuC